MLVGTRDCDEIHELYKSGQRNEIIQGDFYVLGIVGHELQSPLLHLLSPLVAQHAPLLAQAQDNCTSPNSNDDYILGTAEDGTASAMHCS